jgi:hypothetical protein
MGRADAVTIRGVHAAEAAMLLRLAALDSAEPLAGDVLVAEVDGEAWAAIELGSARVIADPFRPTSDVVELLRLRAERLSRPASPRRILRSVLPRLA